MEAARGTGAGEDSADDAERRSGADRRGVEQLVPA
jgi:hypothetical protein